MSFRAQTFVRSQRITEIPAADPLPAAVADVLAEQSKALRAKYRYRGVFARVDKVLAGPRAWQHHQGAANKVLLDPEQIGECEWCGEFFVKTQRSRRYCNRKCWGAHRTFLNSRGRRVVKP